MGLAPLNGAAPWEKPDKKIHKRGKNTRVGFFSGYRMGTESGRGQEGPSGTW